MIQGVNVERFWHYVDKQGPDACWLWLGGVIGNTGYGGFTLQNPKRKRGAHRVAFALHTGKWPQGMVLHSCDTKLCCNPSHLREGSHRDNMDDLKVSGLASRGEQNAKSKLTKDQVKEIRKSSETNASLARQLGVSPATISHIRTGRNWSWL